ncbi:MAG: DUF1566 domain-containing protein [Treponema sp.]|nr:DUF1566 domain-containing protein [Treponema sp.]
MCGYTDWFLPSKDELGLMYKNLKVKGLGGFTDGWYWSSSQGSNTGTWLQNFGDGRQVNVAKYDPNSVRAVRTF